MTDGLRIEIKGLDKLISSFNRFPERITRMMGQAGKDASDKILATRGLQTYPPETAANKPPTPYYIRSRGMQYKTRNAMDSENLKAQWVTRPQGARVTIGNRASYARWVHGEDQAQHMARIGWRKLLDVAREKIDVVRRVYQAWVNKIIRDLGL